MILYFSGYGGLKNYSKYDPEGRVESCNLMLTYSIKSGMKRILLLRLNRILKQRSKK